MYVDESALSCFGPLNLVSKGSLTEARDKAKNVSDWTGGITVEAQELA